MRPGIQQNTLIALLLLIIFTGCSKSNVRETREISRSGLPKPKQVLVYDFSVTPDEVKENSAFFSRLKRDIEHVDQTDEEIQTGHEVADALATELTRKIQELDLNAVRADRYMPVAPGSVLVTGHFITINEGNSLQRMAIGFGLGQSSLDAQVAVLAPEPAGYEELIGFDAHSDSGEMPGAAVTGPAGAAAGAGTAAVVAANAAEGAAKHYRSSSAREAKRMADSIVKNLSKYFSRQGWINPELAQ